MNFSELPHIEGYEIQSFLGQGAFGKVYKARQVNINRTVALKDAHYLVVANNNIIKVFPIEDIMLDDLIFSLEVDDNFSSPKSRFVENEKLKSLQIQLNQESLAFLWAALEVTDRNILPTSQSFDSDGISVAIRYGIGGVMRFGEYAFSHNNKDLHKKMKETVITELCKCSSEIRNNALKIAFKLLEQDKSFYLNYGTVTNSGQGYCSDYTNSLRNFGIYDDFIKTKSECRKLIEESSEEVAKAISNIL